MSNGIKESIKRVVTVGGGCPKTSRVKRVRFVVSRLVVEKFSYAHTSGELVEVYINFSPVNQSGLRTKGESFSEKLSFVIGEGDVRKVNYR